MSGQSRFLPESVSGALRGLCAKLCGVAILILAAWLVVALIFHNPYLTGVAASGNFGTQSLIGNFVGLFRYVIGYVPTLFLFLCIARAGLILLSGATRDGTPEYNILRGFVAICLGAAGFGLIAPRTTYGGMMGAVAAADISNLMGGVGAIVIGVLCLCGFFMIAGILLHISFADVIRIVRNVIGVVRWMLTAFHLMKPVEPETEEESEEEGEEETDEEEEEEKPKPRRKPARRRAVSKSAEVIEYELPDPEFLEKSNFGKSVVTPELKQNARAMEIHFAEYGVNGHVVGIRPGPIVTLYEFKPDSGVRMVDISKTVKDMTRAMATENIRIAHIPRTELIGVEMVNLNRQTVRFQGLVADDAFVNSKYKIPLALGVDIGGNPMYFDLAKMPHVLIAGAPGRVSLCSCNR